MSRAREFADLAGSAQAGGITGKSLIINGAMRIHQRTGTISATGFLVDRFSCTEQTSATFTGSQSTTAPAGFTNSALITIGTGASATSTQYAIIGHNIEGNNIAGLGFGTSDAKNVTLSFWVRSSVTGTFCASIKNSAANRAYIKEYTISVADTWEYKTLTFSGDTTGTWLTDNGIGIRLAFDLGSGSGTPTGAGDSWITTNATRTSSQTDFVSNSGATFYLTGVQLELGEQATPFEHRSYGDELARCQRYYAQLNGANGSTGGIGTAHGIDATSAEVDIFPPVIPMRATATGSLSDASTFTINTAAIAAAASARTVLSISDRHMRIDFTHTSDSNTTHGSRLVRFNSTSAFIAWDAEL